MANLIQATVYQIDGAPQQPSAITLDFQTSNLVIKEATVSTIPSVQSVIFYYNVVNNQQSVQKFFVGEDVATLLAAANSGGTSQVQVTVLEINGDPQVPGGVQYTFPADEILVGESINAVTGVNAYVQFKGVKYFVSETEATILSAANAGGGGGGTNPTNKYIPFNNAGSFADSYVLNDTSGKFVKSVYNLNDIGLKLDFNANQYFLGDYFGVGNSAHVFVDNNFGEVKIFSLNSFMNFYAYGDLTKIGDTFTSGNGTMLIIDDANQRWEMSNNLTAATAGASASKYLKVYINGVTYKIALLANS